MSARAENAGSQGSIQVDIPAQTLATALEIYCAAAGIQMFVDTGLIAGRRSVTVHGEFTREAALRGLLSGTGLAARFVADRGFTLIALPSAEADADLPTHARPTGQRFGNYSAVLQAGLRKALCRNEQTRPGSYRFLGRLWISPAGLVSQAELITSTGNHARDGAVLSALQGAALGETPPPDMPQPVTLLLAPDTTISAGYCAGSEPAKATDKATDKATAEVRP